MVKVSLVLKIALLAVLFSTLALWVLFYDFGVLLTTEQTEELYDLFIPVMAKTTTTEQTTPGRTNINVASLEQLMELDGIGEQRAADIIAYREANGPFVTTAQLLDVPGIGIGIYNNIRYRITIS